MSFSQIFCATKHYHADFYMMFVPFIEYFELNSFWFVDIDRLGHMINIHTEPEWLKHYIQHDYYLVDPCLVSPKNICSGFVLNSSYLWNKVYTQEVLLDAQVGFNLSHTFSLVEKNGNSFQVFTFSADRENTRISSRILSEFTLFKRFVRELQYNIRTFNLDKSLYRVNMNVLKGEYFRIQEGLSYNDKHDIHMKLIRLKKLGLIESSLLGESLSAQEKKTARIYLYRESIKNIASSLGLSVATVNSYITNIKRKSGCSHKSALLLYLEVLESLGKL